MASLAGDRAGYHDDDDAGDEAKSGMPSSPVTAPATEAPAVEAKSVTAPATEEPAVEATSEAPATGAPAAEAASEAPVTEAPAIEVASETADDDEFESIGELFDDTTSVSSSVYAHTYERGRRYQSFKNGRYPIPNDDVEQNREDMKHAMLMELTDGKLFYAPVGEYPQKILDIGTGTGIWAIEVGDAYPSAHIQGIDLAPIQPLWVPPNVEFIVDDCEKDWLTDDIDLAHFRFMAMILRNMPVVLGHAYKSLRPGGWIELQELHGHPYCDDGTMGSDDPFKRLYDLAGQAYQKFGMSTSLPAQLEPLLLDAGFQNVHCKVMKVPIGTWAKDKTMRLIGLYQKTAVGDFISTLGGRPFAALGMSEEEAQVTLAFARKALNDPSVHRYFNYYFWYAQKPGPSSTTF
ncbi:hypothetical protein V495_01056 [Pseudogymnoascus sp. VKM F-4514 (FW-929)]|nr:hypothetical protein V495_01056 [Pseudogymnoascus sp. VKM F-4514 (FW-929)]KFY61628.1 hypothetical protein V497_02819 [Pseudogymnoascus sp. VKM F-4516 (FW-969)]